MLKPRLELVVKRFSNDLATIGFGAATKTRLFTLTPSEGLSRRSIRTQGSGLAEAYSLPTHHGELHAARERAATPALFLVSTDSARPEQHSEQLAATHGFARNCYMRDRRIRLFLLVFVALTAGKFALAQPAPITIDASASGTPLPHFWERMFGSGRAVLALR